MLGGLASPMLAPGLILKASRKILTLADSLIWERIIVRTLLYPLLALGLFGADWPQFRGPNASGLCPSCGQLPTEFGPQKNVLWKTELPVGKSPPS